MTTAVLRANALSIPLQDETVDLIVTSPPYFLLRSYRDEGGHFDGQLGSEDTPTEFVAALLAATREMVRVLKPGGSIFVNLGDKYAAAGGHSGIGSTSQRQGRSNLSQQNRGTTTIPQGFREKSLMGLPWRYALGCIDALGLILRAEILWSKPNGLPESVTDRVRRSHEQLFHFTKEPSYFSAIDEIREPHAPGTAARYAQGYGDRSKINAERPGGYDLGGDEWTMNPLGKLPGSVWSIPSEPLVIPDYFVEDDLGWRMMDAKPLWRYAWHRVVREGNTRPILVRSIDHFAAFPQELPRRLILGWSPPTRAAVVLDPFGGTGTTAGVAHALGRIGISLDLSADYCRLARWRIEQSGHFEKTRQRTHRENQGTLL